MDHGDSYGPECGIEDALCAGRYEGFVIFAVTLAVLGAVAVPFAITAAVAVAVVAAIRSRLLALRAAQFSLSLRGLLEEASLVGNLEESRFGGAGAVGLSEGDVVVSSEALLARRGHGGVIDDAMMI